jgi:hypothetical protein
MKHVEGTISSIGMISIIGPDCQQVMDSECAYSQKELAFTLKQKGNESIPWL